MRSAIILLVFFCFTLMFLSCRTKEKNVINFEEKYPRISLQYHYIFNIEKHEKYMVYEMMLDTNNCHEYISFTVLQQDTEAYKKGYVYFNSYFRDEPLSGSIIRELEFNQNRDTLYSYLKSNDTLVHFTSGKYYYYYNHRNYKLTKAQKEYYEMHRDSIIENGVNEIPGFDRDIVEGKGIRLSP